MQPPSTITQIMAELTQIAIFEMTYTYQKCWDTIGQREAPCIRRIEDDALIPTDPLNTDYQEYLDWVADGNEPLPAD